MIERCVCGFQTGADIGGILAAHKAGIPTGGFMPLGFLTEAGPRPDYAALYGARETKSTDYPERTRKNVEESDSLIWFGGIHTPGFKLTVVTCALSANVPHYVVGGPSWRGDQRDPPVDVWLRRLWEHGLGRTLMIAGNRESKAPGIAAWVEGYLTKVFALLGSPKK